RVAAAALAWMVLGGAALPAAPAGHPEADARKAEAELQAVKSEIERITRQVSLEQVERDRLTQELRTSELSVGKLRDALSGARRARRAPRGAHCRAAGARSRGTAQPSGARRAAARRLPHWPPGASQAAPEPEGPRARRPDVRLLQLLRPRARRADQAHRGRPAASGSARRRAGCRGPGARAAGKTATRATARARARAHATQSRAREPRGAVAHARPESRAAAQSAGGTRETAA